MGCDIDVFLSSYEKNLKFRLCFFNQIRAYRTKVILRIGALNFRAITKDLHGCQYHRKKLWYETVLLV